MAFSDNIFPNIPVENCSHLPNTLSYGSLKNTNSPTGGHFVVYIVEKAFCKFKRQGVKKFTSAENRKSWLFLTQWISGELQKIQESMCLDMANF